MDTLHIGNGLKKIEVNDRGECIEFSVTDNGFFKAFSDLVRWIGSQEQTISEMQEQQEKIVPADGEEINTDALDRVLDIREKISKEACEKIDKIFGADASRKIFDGITPDFWAVIDFFGQVMPLVEKYAKERSQSISTRYSRSRRGAKS